MSFHWTIDGIPACSTPLTGRIELHTSCGYSTREAAQEAIDATKALYPDHDLDFQIVEGGCPQPNDLHSYEFQCGRDAGIEAALSVAENRAALQARLVLAGEMEDPEVRKARENAERATIERHHAIYEASKHD